MSNSDHTQLFLDQLNSGQDPAIEEFCERYYEMLKALAARNMGNHVRAEPESVALSVAACVISGFQAGSYHVADSRKLRNLLLTITLNKIRQRWRKAKRETPTPDLSDLLARGPGHEDFSEFDGLIDDLLQGLEPEYQRILELRLAGHNRPQIAEMMGITDSAVRVRLDRIHERAQRIVARLDRQ